jgi:hypothetical protein
MQQFQILIERTSEIEPINRSHLSNELTSPYQLITFFAWLSILKWLSAFNYFYLCMQTSGPPSAKCFALSINWIWSRTICNKFAQKSLAAPLCRQRAQQLHAQQRYFQFTARSEKGKSAFCYSCAIEVRLIEF